MNNNPTRIDENGNKYWEVDGKLHRENGPAFVGIYNDKAWYKNGQLHRKNGPAMTNTSFEAWYLNGEFHRENGPAIIAKNGNKQWWINGEQMSEKEFNSWKIQNELIQELSKNDLIKKRIKI